MRAVPGYEKYVLHPYESHYPDSEKRCEKMGERCGVKVEADFNRNARRPAFWNCLMEDGGGVRGQKDGWRGADMPMPQGNVQVDHVRINIRDPKLVELDIKVAKSAPSAEKAARMDRYS